MKLTPWFDGDVWPVRRGVYERRRQYGLGPYSYWRGDCWGVLASSPQLAERFKWGRSSYQSLPWRGIAKDKP